MNAQPRDWDRSVMDGVACTVCRWRHRANNGPELHQRHLAHILGGPPRHDNAPPFDARRLEDALHWEPDTDTTPAPSTVHIWLAKDPETERVMVMTVEPGDVFPRGHRGVGWPIRELDVQGSVLVALARAEHTPHEQNLLHRQWWSQAAPEGIGPWPA